MATRSQSRAPYCLYCHHAIGEAFDASVRCGACDRVNLRVDRATYWTLSRSARHSQELLIGVGVFLILLGTAGLMMADTTHYETGWKIFALMGALIPIGLWMDVASLQTRNVSRHRSEVLLPSLFLVFSLAPIAWGLFSWLDRRTPAPLAALQETLGLLLLTVPFAFLMRFFVQKMEEERQELRSSLAARAGRTLGATIHTPPRPRRKRVADGAVKALRGARGLLDARPSSTYDRLCLADREERCLHCFGSMPRVTGASARCPSCEEVTRRLDVRRHWTRHQRDRRLEFRARALGVVVAAVALLQTVRNASALGEITAFGEFYTATFILTCLTLWWDLTGLITRHRTVSRLELLLPVLVSMAGYCWLSVSHLVQESRLDTGERDFWGRRIVHEIDGPAWSDAAPFLLLGLAAHWLFKAALAWRAKLIAARHRAADQRT